MLSEANSRLKNLSEIEPEIFKNRRVLLRLDLNVPIVDGKVADDFRLINSLPTIEYLRRAGAKIAIISHLGRESESLFPVVDWLKKRFEVDFCEKVDDLEMVMAKLPAGGVVLLENIRREAGEETNDELLAKTLALAGDFYVNDAFASAHRAHASIVGIPKFLPSFAGIRLSEEVKMLSRAFNPDHPFLFVLGGAKFETKLPLLERFIEIADQLVIYGALAHAFFKELGYELGESLVDKDTSTAKPFLHHPKIILPADVRVKNGERVFIKTPDTLVVDDNILDVGLISIERLIPLVSKSRFVLWNGPLGNFEQGFRGSTDTVAKLIASSNAESIVGGGDTVSSIRSLGVLDQFDFVSTGGGAMLDFLATGTLVGLEALKTSPSSQSNLS